TSPQRQRGSGPRLRFGLVPISSHMTWSLSVARPRPAGMQKDLLRAGLRLVAPVPGLGMLRTRVIAGCGDALGPRRGRGERARGGGGGRGRGGGGRGAERAPGAGRGGRGRGGGVGTAPGGVSGGGGGGRGLVSGGRGRAWRGPGRPADSGGRGWDRDQGPRNE